MEYDEIDGPGTLPIRVPRDDHYRTCSECGGDCEPEPMMDERLGARIAFTCSKHGVQSLVDPFEDQR
jgi:hypothetical protein